MDDERGKKESSETRARRIFQDIARKASASGGIVEGELTISQLPELLAQVDQELANLDEVQQRHLFELLDSNHDGKVSMHEFVSAFSK